MGNGWKEILVDLQVCLYYVKALTECWTRLWLENSSGSLPDTMQPMLSPNRRQASKVWEGRAWPQRPRLRRENVTVKLVSFMNDVMWIIYKGCY